MLEVLHFGLESSWKISGNMNCYMERLMGGRICCFTGGFLFYSTPPGLIIRGLLLLSPDKMSGVNELFGLRPMA